MAESSREFGRDMHNRPRAMVERSLNPESMPNRALGIVETERISAVATRSGLLYGAAAGVISGSAVFAANALLPRFRGLTVSAKVALAVTPMFGTFFLKSHLEVAHANKNPSTYLNETVAAKAAQPTVSGGSLALWQRAANVVYDHPFKTIVSIVAPLYGAIFHYESTQPATAKMLLSQRLIHTRVYGQAIAIFVTVGVMGVCESMKKDGKYRAAAPEPLPLTAEERFTVQTPVGDPEYGLNSGLLVPLIYAPLLPIMIIGLRSRVQKETLHKIVGVTIAVALAHAGTVMFSDSSVL